MNRAVLSLWLASSAFGCAPGCRSGPAFDHGGRPTGAVLTEPSHPGAAADDGKPCLVTSPAVRLLAVEGSVEGRAVHLCSGCGSDGDKKCSPHEFITASSLRRSALAGSTDGVPFAELLPRQSVSGMGRLTATVSDGPVVLAVGIPAWVEETGIDVSGHFEVRIQGATGTLFGGGGPYMLTAADGRRWEIRVSDVTISHHGAARFRFQGTRLA